MWLAQITGSTDTILQGIRDVLDSWGIVMLIVVWTCVILIICAVANVFKD